LHLVGISLLTSLFVITFVLAFLSLSWLLIFSNIDLMHLVMLLADSASLHTSRCQEEAPKEMELENQVNMKE